MNGVIDALRYLANRHSIFIWFRIGIFIGRCLCDLPGMEFLAGPQKLGRR
jgi:hypothetical protein